MKSLVLLLSMTFFASGHLYSQGCSSSVHANAISVSNQQQLVKSDFKYWVCDGGVLILTGNRNSIWVDRGGTLSLSGDSNYVYVRENATVTIAENYNFVDIDVDVIQAGNYTDNGTNTTKKNCDPMSFDYTTAPSGGCMWWSNVDNITMVKDAEMYPNPASELTTIVFPEGSQGIYAVQVIDMEGKVVLTDRVHSSDNKFEIDVSSLPNGMYNVSMRNDDVLVNKKFSVEH